MSITVRPTGESLARGTHELPAGALGEAVELVMEAQAMLMRAQRILSSARFVPAWNGTERRLS